MSDDDPDDASALLAQYLKDRSDPAFTALVRHYLPLVYHAALRQVRDEQLAEDVSQAVFILLAQKAHTFSPGDFLPAWLYKTTRYACANLLRTENRRRKLETEKARMTQPTTTEPALNWNELSPELDKALATLGKRDRQLLLLRYFEDLDTLELSTRLGISEPAARKRLSRALDRLRQSLSRRGVTASTGALADLMTHHFAPQVPTQLAHTIASASLAGAPKAAALAASTASSMLLTKSFVISSIAALFAITVIGAVTVVHFSSATTPAAPPIKLGWMVSEWTADEHLYADPGTYDCVTAIRPRFDDPQLEIFAIVEPGTESADSMRPILRQYFKPNHVIDGADPSALSKLDVIVLSRDWNMRPAVMSAILQAVRNGTGLLRHTSAGLIKNDGDDADVAEINCVDQPQLYIYKIPPAAECRIVSSHPLLAGLDKSLQGATLPVNVLNGCQGLVHGTALITVNLASENNADPMPTTQPAADDQLTFVPLFVSQIGKGKVVACQWDSIPKPLFDATNGRFYIHCVQWLANRPIQ